MMGLDHHHNHYRYHHQYHIILLGIFLLLGLQSKGDPEEGAYCRGPVLMSGRGGRLFSLKEIFSTTVFGDGAGIYE